MPSDSDLAAALARTRQSYDDTPYDHAPMMRSHPGRLAARAAWRGLGAPDPARARVLEIGCASGGNLLPLADMMPEASFLGVDLSPKQIEAGEARRLRFGLANVELRAQSFEALGEADGAFDFIICHGVYSWIPEPLRESLLRVTRERLAPNGVAMVSFNVLPGWRVFQIARDSMLLNARMIDPALRTQKTRELFELLAAQSVHKNTYGKFWRDEARHMAGGGDAYLAHEIFEDANSPETFFDFAARAARFDLAYLGEAAVVANNEADLAPEGAQSIRALSGDDPLMRETYIDIFSGRSFREALLVHRSREAFFAPEPPLEALRTLHFIPALDLEAAAAPDGLRLAVKDLDLTFHDPALEPGLRRLIERKPASSRLADLGADGDAEPLAEALRMAVETGVLAISTMPVVCANRLAERPTLWPFVAREAGDGENTVTRRHSAFQFAPLQRILAPFIDGTRTRDDLVAAALDLASRGALTVGGPEGAVTDPIELRRQIERATDNALAGLLRNGLLLATEGIVIGG